MGGTTTDTVIELLTPGEVKGLIRISDSTLRNWRLNGKIQYVEIAPRVYRYPAWQFAIVDKQAGR
ncbi:MAG: hypothetical protein HQL61_07810 [Magnetococcales bacterium]|nr:hypothetical protein [Nitrospirota bacterium]